MTTPAAAAEEPKVPSSYRNWMGILTLVLLLAILIGFWQYSETLINTIEHQSEELAQGRTHIQDHESILRVLESPDLQVFILRSPLPSNAAGGRLFWDSQTGVGLLHLSGLAKLDAEQHYQLWSIGDQTVGVPESSPVHGTDSTATSWRLVRSANGRNAPTGFQVTIESTRSPKNPSAPPILKSRPR